VLRFEGRLVSLVAIRKFQTRMELLIIKVWEEQVMMGVKQHVDIGEPTDSFTNTLRGYSFTYDGHFPQFHKFLGRRFLQDPELQKHFISTDERTGVVTFNAQACHKWFQSLAYVEALLMILIEMRSGGPIRLAELASTLACNIETRSRNLYAYGPQILIVSQYNKTTNNHQGDSVSPHALCAFDADMIVQIHTLARPFAQV
jgi:hypothetical protein